MRNFIKLLTPYFTGDQKKYARWGLFLLVLLSQCSTSFGYFFIKWNKRFYDALASRDGEQFVYECFIFLGLAAAFVTIFGITKYFSQQYALKWRVWMTSKALTEWMHYEKRGELEGSDQRIQEDLMRFTMLFERFFLECFNAVLLILLFIPLLFSETRDLYLKTIPLCWLLPCVAIVYTIVGMYISAKIANPLVQLEYDNQKLEAELRYNLVHIRDGEQRETGFFKGLFRALTKNYHLIYRRQRNFNIWQRGYDQFSYLIPFCLLGSNYFAGIITLGMLMQIKATFSRIRNSMAYLLDHYTEITEMLAIIRRLNEFYGSVDDLHATDLINARPQTELNV